MQCCFIYGVLILCFAINIASYIGTFSQTISSSSVFCLDHWIQFYEKGGKTLPGKKGISLTLEQYKALKGVIMDGSLDEQIKELEG